MTTDNRDYTPEDLEWMKAYSPELLDLLASLMIIDNPVGHDMTYFMHLIQVGHMYEMGEFDD